jgi:hypothetical protein
MDSDSPDDFAVGVSDAPASERGLLFARAYQKWNTAMNLSSVRWTFCEWRHGLAVGARGG